MKNTVIILFISIFLVLLSSCKTEDVSNITADTVEIYSTAVWDDSENSTYFSKGNAKDHGLNLLSDSKKLNDVSQKKKITIDNNDIVLEYHKTSIFSEETSFDNYNRAFDEYSGSTDASNISVWYLHNTDTMRNYYTSNTYHDNEEVISPPELSNEQLIEKVDLFLRNNFKIKNIKKYNLKECSLQNVAGQQMYCLLFQKSIHGYLTDDSVTMFMSLYGEVISCNAKKYGLMNNMEKQYSKKQLDTTYNVLKQQLSESEISDNVEKLVPRLSTSIYGDLYIYVSVTHSLSNGQTISEKIYAKVPS